MASELTAQERGWTPIDCIRAWHLDVWTQQLMLLALAGVETRPTIQLARDDLAALPLLGAGVALDDANAVEAVRVNRVGVRFRRHPFLEGTAATYRSCQKEGTSHRKADKRHSRRDAGRQRVFKQGKLTRIGNEIAHKLGCKVGLI